MQACQSYDLRGTDHRPSTRNMVNQTRKSVVAPPPFSLHTIRKTVDPRSNQKSQSSTCRIASRHVRPSRAFREVQVKQRCDNPDRRHTRWRRIEPLGSSATSTPPHFSSLRQRPSYLFTNPFALKFGRKNPRSSGPRVSQATISTSMPMP